jgi:hypothetical protein
MFEPGPSSSRKIYNVKVALRILRKPPQTREEPRDKLYSPYFMGFCRSK